VTVTPFNTSPTFPLSVTPTLPLLGLNDSERQTIKTLEGIALRDRSVMLLTEAYYLGEQVIQNLRIAVPKELEFLRTIVGWPAIAVDPLVERLSVDGFRLANATDADMRMGEIWDANGGGVEQSLAFTDALSMGRAYWAVGSPLETGGAPQITVESPLNMTVLWDLRGLSARAAMQEYWDADRKRGALLLPNQTVHLAVNDAGEWEVVDRDEHGYDFVPVHRMANRPRTNWRDGRSEITPAMRSIVDAACRTLLGLEVAREIYSVPQKVILGAAEDAFVKSDGTPKSAWDTYITKTLGLERDENGDLPDIKQMQAYDPSVFTKLMDMYASQMAGQLSAPPQDLGLYTQGNPINADSAQVSESRRDRRAVLRQQMFGTAITRAIQDAIRFENKGRLPAEFERVMIDWHDVKLESPATTSDAITKQIAAGSIPATSDVTLKRLGYTAVERAQLEQDRKREDGRQIAKALAASLTGSTGGDTAAAPAGQ
jgi:hypothetical protein